MAKSILNIIQDHQLFEKSILLARNEWLSVSGKTDTNIYFITEGSVRIYIADGEEERVVRLAYKNDLFGCLDSLFTGKPTVFYMQAIKRTTVQAVQKQVLTKFLEKDIESLKLWVTLLENLVVQQLERENDLLTSSPKERYENVLRRSPHLFQEIPARHIANYLRMTPETLSRLKKP